MNNTFSCIEKLPYNPSVLQLTIATESTQETRTQLVHMRICRFYTENLPRNTICTLVLLPLVIYMMGYPVVDLGLLMWTLVGDYGKLCAIIKWRQQNQLKPDWVVLYLGLWKLSYQFPEYTWLINCTVYLATIVVSGINSVIPFLDEFF
jgi:hypothetical protein